MANSTKTITGCFSRLTVKYLEVNKAYFMAIYWDDKYVHRTDVVSHKKIANNQVSGPTIEDVENYLYQVAVDRLYSVKNEFGNPKFIMN